MQVQAPTQATADPSKPRSKRKSRWGPELKRSFEQKDRDKIVGDVVWYAKAMVHQIKDQLWEEERRMKNEAKRRKKRKHREEEEKVALNFATSCLNDLVDATDKKRRERGECVCI